MSLLIALHAIDHIVLCGDHRALSVCADGSLVPSDGDHKILQWSQGAIAGNGERWLTNAVMLEFCEPSEAPIHICDLALKKTQQRMEHGVPFEVIRTSAWFLTEFKNSAVELHSVCFNDEKLIMERINPRQLEVFGAHASPTRIARFKSIQQRIRPSASFASDVDFMAYYVDMLSHLYHDESLEDATVSASFDFYVQSCLTGKRALIRHQNHLLSEVERRHPMPTHIACHLPCLDHVLGRSSVKSKS